MNLGRLIIYRMLGDIYNKLLSSPDPSYLSPRQRETIISDDALKRDDKLFESRWK